MCRGAAGAAVSIPEQLQLTADAPLRARNTFGVAARARWLAQASNVEAARAAFALAERESLPVEVLGGGSNVLIVSDLDALVLLPQLRGIEWLGAHADRMHVRVAAGENWHAFVMAALRHGAYGLENLALIPGSVGAAPIQNIGAYGVELEEFVVAIEALDRSSDQISRLLRADCQFGYRDSVFKQAQQRERYLITAVEFALKRTPELKLGYAGIREELSARELLAPTALDVCAAVCAIRRAKLPDPALIGNAGSFFKNPVVPIAQARALQSAHPTLTIYPLAPERAKLPAAWLIDQCGWKGYRSGDAGVHADHALVLVNHGHASGAELLALARRIADSVHARFDVQLEAEPRVLGRT